MFDLMCLYEICPESLSFFMLDFGCEAFAIFCSTTESVSVDFLSRGWGHMITWNGPMMGHLNSFLASGVVNLNKDFPKIQMPRGLPGWGDVQASII